MLSITMNSRKYILILFALAIPVSLDSTQAVLFNESEDAKSLIAYEDTEKCLREMDKYNKDFGKNWVVMADGNGQPIFSIMDKSSFYSAKKRFELPFEKVEEKVKLYLYTLEKPEAVEFKLNSLNQIKLNSSSSVKIICHGWMADSNSSVIQNIKDAYLTENYDNVIAVDWSYFSKDFLYLNAAISANSVGNHLGQLIDNLVKTQEIQYKDIHIIGHSLGAHVAGFAGNTAKERVGRITGLDPALPGFQYIQELDGRLDSSDAIFVDVIHTCSGVLGMSLPSGHVDFYPNGGSPFQPGCCNSILLSSEVACSHSRSHEYFVESIYKHSEFLAVKCSDWNHFKSKDCGDVFTLMGEHVAKNITGIFYLKTNEEHPFYKGYDAGMARYLEIYGEVGFAATKVTRDTKYLEYSGNLDEGILQFSLFVAFKQK